MSKPWWTPSPHENAEAHARVMERLKKMSREELIESGVRAGTREPDGQLTPPYRATACGSADESAREVDPTRSEGNQIGSDTDRADS